MVNYVGTNPGRVHEIMCTNGLLACRTTFGWYFSRPNHDLNQFFFLGFAGLFCACSWIHDASVRMLRAPEECCFCKHSACSWMNVAYANILPPKLLSCLRSSLLWSAHVVVLLVLLWISTALQITMRCWLQCTKHCNILIVLKCWKLIPNYFLQGAFVKKKLLFKNRLSDFWNYFSFLRVLKKWYRFIVN